MRRPRGSGRGRTATPTWMGSAMGRGRCAPVAPQAPVVSQSSVAEGCLVPRCRVGYQRLESRHREHELTIAACELREQSQLPGAWRAEAPL